MSVTNIMPEDVCPVCGTMADRASDPDPKTENYPKPGDLSLCWQCGALLQFDIELRLTRADESILNTADKDQVSRYRALWAIVRGKARRREG